MATFGVTPVEVVENDDDLGYHTYEPQRLTIRRVAVAVARWTRDRTLRLIVARTATHGHARP